MANHLTKFDTQTAYQQFKSSQDFVRPNVSYCGDNKEVYYNPNLIITFFINNTPFLAELGMTWAEWVNSLYNTDGYYVNSNYSIMSTQDTNVLGLSAVSVLATDVILPLRYETVFSGGGSND